MASLIGKLNHVVPAWYSLCERTPPGFLIGIGTTFKRRQVRAAEFRPG